MKSPPNAFVIIENGYGHQKNDNHVFTGDAQARGRSDLPVDYMI